MLDVAVVGGGPAGGRAAWLLAEAGLSVALYEEHQAVGEPCQCAGLVTERVFEELGFRQPTINRVDGARIHGPTGFAFAFRAGKPRGLVIDRPALDRSIVERARRAGVAVHTGARVSACRRDKGGVAFRVKQREATTTVRARALIGADGPASRVARAFSLAHQPELLPAYGAEIEGWQGPRHSVDLFVGSALAPSFFGWAIPTTNGHARLGLALKPGHGPARDFFNRLFTHPATAPLLEGCKVIKTLGGAIPLGHNPKPYTDGVLLVGDAAGMAKPTSGGGIYTGLISARLAAETLAIALKDGGRPTARALAPYGDRLHRQIGRELKRGMRLRKAFLKLDDTRLEELLRLLSDPKLLALIQRQGDIDYTSRLATAVLKQKPQLLKFAPLLLKPFV